MTRLCLICSREAQYHPEVGFGYLPHPFEPADVIHTEGYVGPERRKGVRRMDDRVAAIEHAVASVYDHPENGTDHRKGERRRP